VSELKPATSVLQAQQPLAKFKKLAEIMEEDYRIIKIGKLGKAKWEKNFGRIIIVGESISKIRK